MKRKDLIKQITSIGWVLVRHGQRHDLHPVRNNAPLLSPSQRLSKPEALRPRLRPRGVHAPEGAAGLHFK